MESLIQKLIIIFNVSFRENLFITNNINYILSASAETYDNNFTFLYKKNKTILLNNNKNFIIYFHKNKFSYEEFN